ncbi:uncharacterized protein LOC135370596 [Ornithodoros turicata]|uniref:uncharacterized protein LOC135370596 n=1 Tax=Ornithodoros turicata TaxID=34597 RepID=UPI003138A1B3
MAGALQPVAGRHRVTAWLACAVTLMMVTAAFAFTTGNTERKCTNDQYQQCLQSLENVAKGEDLTLVTSKRELDNVCRRLKQVVYCVDEHTAKCFEETLQRVFNQVVAGAKEIIAEVCIPGPTQDDFLRHARCNRNVTMDATKCAPAYRRTLMLAKTVSQDKDVDQGLKRSCCAFSEFVQCKNFHVTRDCGARASAFFARHMQRISGPLMDDHCGQYAFGTESCNPSSSRSSVTRDPLGVVWLALMLVFTSVPR